MSYSANDNQNYFVAAGKTTSRVLSQPGGQCSIALGGWTPEELERQRQIREGKSAPKTEEGKKRWKGHSFFLTSNVDLMIMVFSDLQPRKRRPKRTQ